MSRHNKARAERFKTKPTSELEKIQKSGSLASAAAEYELRRRGK